MGESKFYEVKVSVKTETDGGKIKKVTETYIVNAIGVVDAEAIITKDFEGDALEWEVLSVRETKILKVLRADD